MRLTAFSVACICLGLLLWARLVIITGYPRTATARPDESPSAHSPSSPQDAAPPAESSDADRFVEYD